MLTYTLGRPWRALAAWSGLAIFFFALPLRAQQSEWVRRLDPSAFTASTTSGNGRVWGPSVTTDAQGFTYALVEFKDSAVVGNVRLGSRPLPSTYTGSARPTSVAIFKFSPSGQIMWWRQPASVGASAGQLQLGQEGNLIVTMSCNQCTMGTLSTRAPVSASWFGQDLVVLSYTLDGQLEWAKRAGTALAAEARVVNQYQLTVDTAGNIIIPGGTSGAVQVANQALPTSSDEHSFLLKLDSKGNPLWTIYNRNNNSLTSYGRYAAVDKRGNIWFSGYCQDGLVFGNFSFSFSTTSSSARSYLLQVSPGGQILSARGIDGLQGCLQTHPSGDVVLSLSTAIAVPNFFGLALTSGGRYLLRISPAGVARQLMFPAPIVQDIKIDQTGNIYLFGIYRSAFPFPPTPPHITLPPATTASATQSYVVACSGETGQLLWGTSVLYNAWQGGFLQATVDQNGAAYVSGYYRETIVLGSDTLHPQNRQRPTAGYLWKVRPPLGFGVAGPRRIVCPGTSFTLPVQRDSAFFAAGATFTIQLSDSNGSFAALRNLDTVAASVRSVTVTVPAGVPPGRAYRVRLLASSPAISSSGDGLALEIRPAGFARVLPEADTVATCPGQLLPLLRAEATYGSQLQWTLNGQPLPGATADTLRPSQPGAYAVQATGSRCGNAVSAPLVVRYRVPAVTLAPFASVNVNAAPFGLSGGQPAGGIYSGPGVSNNTFNPAAAGVGTHTIIYTATDGNGCQGQTTQTLVVTPPVGLSAAPAVMELTLVPNPTPGPATLRLVLPTAAPLRVTLHNALGQELGRSQKPSTTVHELALPVPPAAGVYTVRLALPGGVLTRRLVVQP